MRIRSSDILMGHMVDTFGNRSTFWMNSYDAGIEDDKEALVSLRGVTRKRGEWLKLARDLASGKKKDASVFPYGFQKQTDGDGYTQIYQMLAGPTISESGIDCGVGRLKLKTVSYHRSNDMCADFSYTLRQPIHGTPAHQVTFNVGFKTMLNYSQEAKHLCNDWSGYNFMHTYNTQAVTGGEFPQGPALQTDIKEFFSPRDGMKSMWTRVKESFVKARGVDVFHLNHRLIRVSRRQGFGRKYWLKFEKTVTRPCDWRTVGTGEYINVYTDRVSPSSSFRSR